MRSVSLELGLCAALGVLGLGCTTLADVSSGQVGCPPEEITITDERQSWGAKTWTAQCRGQTYQCSGHGGGEASTPQVSCTPMGGTQVPGGSNAAPPSGCQYDTQCKGERICRDGACVDPAVPSEPAPTPPATTPTEPPPDSPPPAAAPG